MSKVLLPIDVNRLESRLSYLDRAIKHVRALQSQFLLMTVISDYNSYFVGPFLPDNFLVIARSKAAEGLDAFAERYLPSDLVAGVSVRAGVTHAQIITVAEEEKVDLIFLGADPPEPVDHLLGTLEGRILRQAPCDVVFFRST